MRVTSVQIAAAGALITGLCLLLLLVKLLRGLKPIREENPLLAEVLPIVMEDKALQELVLAVVHYRKAWKIFCQAQPEQKPVEAATLLVQGYESNLARRFREALQGAWVSEALARALTKEDEYAV